MKENLVFLNNKFISKKKIIELQSNAEIYSMNFDVHQYLESNSIKHEIAENILNQNDLDTIFDKATSLYSWYKNIPDHSEMEFHGINLFEMMDTTELHTFLIKKLYDIFIVKKIIENKNPKKVYSTFLKESFSQNFDNKIEFIEFKYLNDQNMIWDKIEIKFNIGKFPISFRIPRNFYLKSKTIFENFISSLYNLNFNKNDKRESILLLEFNPSAYSNLIKNLAKSDKQIIFFNNRRSAVWNSSSINLLKSENCKILTKKSLLNSNDKIKIKNELVNYEKTMKKLFLSDNLSAIFSIYNISFWDEIKIDLTTTFRNRLHWYMELIYSSIKIQKNIKLHSILSLNVIGETEKSILSQIKDNTHSIMLEHAFANYTKELSRYDILSNYSLFPDKIAVWGNVQKEYLNSIHQIPDNRIIVSGSPRHDSFFEYISNSSDKKNSILFCPRPIIELTGSNTTEMYIKYERILKTTIDNFKKFSNMEITVKLHPGDIPHNDIIKNIIHKIDPKITIYHSKPIHELITKSNLVVILSPDGYDPSTVILESVIFEKPVVNLVLDEKFFNFSYEIHNAVISITEKDDIQQIIHKILNDKNFKSELLSNGKNFLDGYMKNHKNASKYLAQKILDLNENN